MTFSLAKKPENKKTPLGVCACGTGGVPGSKTLRRLCL
ncbi:hypothetical protein Agau_L100599 [Agrobacterium tumefaciens F2]|nr:hypothetical protein Agau_L100599 [Agrobacterium tumefaciens F2]